MTKKDRLLDVFERLRYEKVLSTKKEFAECIGFDKTNLSSAFNGSEKYLTDNLFNKVADTFPQFDRVWLLTGEGEMLIRPEDKITEKRGIPFYDINVTASIAESFNDIPDVSQYLISYPPLNDCCAAFPVYGESMEPDFFAGEVVLVKEITNVDSMLWGEPYLVITNANCDNLRTIKNVYLSEDRCKFILRATNPRFSGDTIIDRNDVLKIFLIKGKINRRQL